ncbi:MAG: hypothetical protein K9K88_04965 [Desulfobacterales bacterium]|nr:hypothetical protein [Desulfobacterales bacterium]
MNRKEIDTEVFDLLSRAGPAKQKPSPFLFLAMVLVILLTATAFGYGFYQSHFGPRGKITRPIAQSIVPRCFELRGFTESIPPERRYLWIMVDVPDLGLSWPKRRIYGVNEPLETKISEHGPNHTFIVSFYALDRDYTDEILEWFEENRLIGQEGGFPISPRALCVDSLSLRLKGRSE